ncbi:MAG TPA: dUTP diphosphatase [Myxococcaceae bacterium]|nr:dUTP diphosphatase [Myxococcaceae bacterium]
MSSAAVELKVTRVRPSSAPLPLPAYQTEGSAGLDLMADVEGTLTLPPLGRAAVPTGLALAIPPGYEGQVRPRSGLALKHGISMPNSPGTIDSDYRGELKVLLVNLSNEPFTIERGTRIAQLVLCPVARASLREVQVLDETARGHGGFGSTGTVAR